MSAPKYLVIGGVTLFALIGALSVIKKKKEDAKLASIDTAVTIENEAPPIPPKIIVKKEEVPLTIQKPVIDKIMEVDRISELFATRNKKLPIVETITYKSRVPWLKGRPAWITDYASHFQTSRHFIARSLNGKADYEQQRVSSGDRFNVFKKEKNFQFYLLVDLSRCKMFFYYLDLDENTRVLLKTYSVGIGRVDSSSPSGFLTPSGKYLLGQKVAIYNPGVMGYYQDQLTEMIQVFGTRWIPFDQEVSNCTADPRGYGIHGSPWEIDSQNGELVEVKDAVSTYDSDGCIRLYQKDMEELFSIVISKPTIVEIVKDYKKANLPGVESNVGS